jgi:hypothetical protein
MPMYYFHLCDDETIVDPDGTDLVDIGAARDHAAGVARELTANSDGFLKQKWSQWTMTVHDDVGTELFSIAMSDLGNGNSGK